MIRMGITRRMSTWTRPCPGLTILRRGDAPIRAIQVYGQRCSGTNVLIRSIEANLGRGALPKRMDSSTGSSPNRCCSRAT